METCGLGLWVGGDRSGDPLGCLGSDQMIRSDEMGCGCGCRFRSPKFRNDHG
jgi:hypothetical protein